MPPRISISLWAKDRADAERQLRQLGKPSLSKRQRDHFEHNNMLLYAAAVRPGCQSDDAAIRKVVKALVRENKKGTAVENMVRTLRRKLGRKTKLEEFVRRLQKQIAFEVTTKNKD